MLKIAKHISFGLFVIAGISTTICSLFELFSKAFVSEYSMDFTLAVAFLATTVAFFGWGVVFALFEGELG